MHLPSYFSDFLAEIRPTSAQYEEARRAQKALRKRLEEDEELGPTIVSTFLQGSTRRATAVRPGPDDKLDADVIAVTRLSMEEYSPNEAIQQFVPFLDKHYSGKYRIQGRSIGIELSGIKLDLVVTATPSESEIGLLKSKSVTAAVTPEEALDWRLVETWVPLEERSTSLAESRMRLAAKQEEWKLSPLYIPDREANEWQPTHPLETMKWTWDKNRRCNGHYVNVVKALKWWRAENDPNKSAPKGYPLEHIIGVACPENIDSVAEGLTLSLEGIVGRFDSYAAQSQTPFLPAHGVPSQNVLHRVSGKEFAAFFDRAQLAAEIARRALDEEDLDASTGEWKRLLGDKFPDPPGDSGERAGGYTPRRKETTIGGGRFA